MPLPKVLMISDVAQHLGVTPKALRLAESRGQIPPAQRCGPFRVWVPSDLPDIEAGLRAAGKLPAAEVAV